MHSNINSARKGIDIFYWIGFIPEQSASGGVLGSGFYMIMNYFTLQRCCWVVREQGENPPWAREWTDLRESTRSVVSNGIDDLIYNKRRMCLLLSKVVVLLEKVGKRE